MKKFKPVLSVLVVITMLIAMLPTMSFNSLAATARVFEAENTSGVAESREVKSDRIICDRTRSSVNYPLFTEDLTIAPGHYRVLIFMNLLEEPVNDLNYILMFDIYGDKGNGMEVMYPAFVIRSQFSALNKFEPIMVEFTTAETLTTAQLRFHYNKNASIEIDKFNLLDDSSYYVKVEAETLGTQLPSGSMKAEGILAQKGVTGQKLATWGWGGTIPAGARKAVLHMKLLDKTGNPDNTVTAFEVGVASGTKPATAWFNEGMFPVLNKYYSLEVPFNLTTDLTGTEPYIWAALGNVQSCSFLIDYIEFTDAGISTSSLEGNISTFETEVTASQTNTRSISADGQAVECDPAVNDIGFFTFGNDLTFNPGTYKISAVMKIKGRTANPNEKFATVDTYYNVAGVAELGQITAIHDSQFASLDTWTNVDFYFKTATDLTNVQIRMKSEDKIDFLVDKFIITKLQDTASIVVQAENVEGSLTGNIMNEGIKCVVGDVLDWATFGTRVVLETGKYNILVYAKQLQTAANQNAPILTFQSTYVKGGNGYSSPAKTFFQSDFPSSVDTYKAFCIPLEVADGERYTEMQLLTRFEGSTDIVIDRYEILPAITFGSLAVSSANVISKVSLGETVGQIKAAMTPNVATAVSSKFDTDVVGTGTTIDATINGYTATYTILIYGDVDGDGQISPSDLIAIKRNVLKVTTLTGINKDAADISKKGFVSISDLLAVKKHVLGAQLINQG